MAAAAPPAESEAGPLANPSSSPSPNPVFNGKVPDKLDEPIPEHHGVGRVVDSGEAIHMGTDGVGRVGDQEGVDGGNPQMGVDGGGDRHMGTDGGGGGTRQRCKNRRQKHNGGSLVPNTTKMQVGEGELHSEKRHPDYRNEPTNPRLKKSKNKLASPVVRSPMQMASSPGVNMLMRSAALARDSLRAGKWMGEVKSTMQELFNEYTEEVSVQSQRESDTEEVEDDDDPLVEWDQYMRSKKQQSSNELDRYLKEELTPRKVEVDILEWWKINSSKYPVLSKMARDILAIPASTVPSESAFSTGGRVISDYRSSLACSTVEALVCLQDWFKAACDLDDE